MHKLIKSFARICLLMLMFAAISCSKSYGAAFQGQNNMRIAANSLHCLNFGGRRRTYLLHLPPCYESKERLPAVIVLHGGGGNHRFASRMSSMSVKADKEGFVVAYPDGTGRLPNFLLTWNAGDCCGYALEKQVDDVGFISTLIDDLVAKLNVDPKRIYVTGISNGAMMAYQLACQLSSKIAAVAPVAGSMSGREPEPTDPISVIVFHGTNDHHVPYNGGTGKLARWGFPVNKQSVSYAISYWVRHDQCMTAPVFKHTGNCDSVVYTGGKRGAEVVLCTINGQGHAWPGGVKAWFGADEPVKDVKATDIIWDFFSRHPKQ